MARIDAFLELGKEQGCSDLHFTIGLPPLVRLDGQLNPIKYRNLSREEITAIFMEILDQNRMDHLNEMGSIDFSYAVEGVGRFRVNLCRQHLGLSAVCRVITESVPELDSLGLPNVVKQFSTLRSGLVLVTGATGTGKSTTMAAMINEINKSRNLNIITLEDPIEFVHESQKSLVLQREMGTQVRSFGEGLRSALRQDPDVIMVGEMRDYETISLAIEACETGHLVLGTLHTRGAYQTIHRIVDAFPTPAQAQIRHTLSENLKAVVSQELVRAFDGRGRRAVVEIMVMTAAISQLIREAKTHQIPSNIATGKRVGMQLMDQALLALVRSGDIDPNEAFLKSQDRKEFAHFVTDPELHRLVNEGGQDAAA